MLYNRMAAVPSVPTRIAIPSQTELGGGTPTPGERAVPEGWVIIGVRYRGDDTNTQVTMRDANTEIAASSRSTFNMFLEPGETIPILASDIVWASAPATPQIELFLVRDQ